MARIAVDIDPSGARSGARVVKREFDGISDSARRTRRETDRIGDTAQTSLRKAAKAARGYAGALKAAAVAATAFVVGGVAVIRSALNTVDAQTKLARSLVTTTESVQILARAGDLAGVSMGEIEQATIQLTKRLSLAAAGTGPAADALEQLGLSAIELTKIPLDERISAIQDALAAFVPVAQRAGVATKIFGDRAGLTFTRIDSATLRQATKDISDFGVGVSELDAAQIEVTNDALSLLGEIWRGLANQLAVAVAPALESVANALAAAAREGGALHEAIENLGPIFDRVTAYAKVAAVIIGFTVLGKALKVARLAASGLSVALKALSVPLGLLRKLALVIGLGELINFLTGAKDATEQAVGPTDTLTFAINEQKVAQEALNIALGNVNDGNLDSVVTAKQAAKANLVAARAARTRAIEEFKLQNDYLEVLRRSRAAAVGDLQEGLKGGVYTSFASALQRGTVDRVDRELDEALVTARAIEAVIAAQSDIISETQTLIDNLNADAGLIEIAGAAATLRKEGEAAAASLERLFGDSRERGRLEAIELLNTAIKAGTILESQRAEILAQIEDKYKAVEAAAAGTGNAAQEAAEALRDLFRDPNEAGLAAALQKLEIALRGGAISAEEYAAILAKLPDLFKDANEAAATLNQNVDSISESFLTSFLDIARGTATVKDAFRSLANDIIDELYRVLVVQKLVGSISGFLETGINALTGSIFGGGQATAVISGGGSGAVTTSSFQPLRRAHGGRVERDRPYLVGEQGREIFRPDQSGMIIPNNRISSSRSGQQAQAAQVNQTVNISAFSDGDIDRVLAKRMPQLQQLILAALLKQQSVGAI